VRRLCADTRLAGRLLGFAPAVSMRDGLQRLLDWYRSLLVDPAVLLEQEIVHNWTAPEAM
jgi:UDP-glucose 4-epimerase